MEIAPTQGIEEMGRRITPMISPKKRLPIELKLLTVERKKCVSLVNRVSHSELVGGERTVPRELIGLACSLIWLSNPTGLYLGMQCELSRGNATVLHRKLSTRRQYLTVTINNEYGITFQKECISSATNRRYPSESR